MTTDAELIRAARSDAAAFRELYDRYAERMYRFHLGRSRDADAAHDLTAETFAQAWLGRTRFRDEAGGSAGPWLFGIARDVLSASVRRGRLERGACARLGILERLDREPAAVDPVAFAASQLLGPTRWSRASRPERSPSPEPSRPAPSSPKASSTTASSRHRLRPGLRLERHRRADRRRHRARERRLPLAHVGWERMGVLHRPGGRRSTHHRRGLPRRVRADVRRRLAPVDTFLPRSSLR